jgi:hypothetical protein
MSTQNRRFPTHLSLPPEERPVLASRRGAADLIKSLSGCVRYPDGEQGGFDYCRLGPACHRFDYRWKDGTTMPRQFVTRPLPEATAAGIAKTAQDLAFKAFWEAVGRERRERFARVSLAPGESTALLKFRWRLCACEARTNGGRYAICLRIGSHWVRLSTVYDTIEEAADRWRDRVNDGAVICCLHRRNRRWERPKFDPLRAEPGYTPHDEEEKTAGGDKPAGTGEEGTPC